MESRKNRTAIYQIAAYAAPICSVLIWYGMGEKEERLVWSKLVMTLIVTGLFLLHLLTDRTLEKKSCRYPVLVGVSYIVSFVLLGMCSYLPIGALWLLAVPVVEAVQNEKTAQAVLTLLCVQYAILVLPQNKDFTLFVKYLVFGYLLLILYRGLDSKKSVWYFLGIVAVFSLVLQIVVYEFEIGQIKSEMISFLWGIGSEILLGICSVSSYLLLDKKTADEETQEEVQAETKEIVQDQITENDRIFLQSIIEPDFDLFVRLQHYSLPLLSHSMHISGLSEQAALFIGAEPLLAKAGGLYHEVGRIVDEEDYIEAGTKLARQYRFPNALVHVMRQHSTGFEKPDSKEAAIVMLSDCIVSTSDYLQDTGKRGAVSDERLVDSIFQNRMDKGNLDEAGFSKEQIEQLKEFYIRNAF